ILSLLILLAVFGAEVGVYLGMRHKRVGLADLKRQFKEWKAGGRDKALEKAAASAGRITLMGTDGKPLPIPSSENPDRASYDAIQLLLTHPIVCGAQQIDLAPEGEGLGVKFTVDNFAHKGAMFDRAVGAAAISYIKWAAGLNVEDRRKPQTANMKV